MRPKPRNWIAFLLMAVGALASASEPEPQRLRAVPLIGLPCEGCEAAFDGVPPALPTRLRLSAAEAAGTPMHVRGRVLDADGSPRAGVVLYVYQTDSHGVYPPLPAFSGLGHEARRHGRLRGWVRSDAAGRYAIDTVRPGSYPGETIPEHIHMQVIEPGCVTYLIDDLVFRDDPKLTAGHRRQLVRGTGGEGLVTPLRTADGWQVERDVVLGRKVPGYRGCQAGLR